MPTKKEKQPLSVTHPELAKEADGWDPRKIGSGSGKKLPWKCSKGHKWEAVIRDRAKRSHSKCPICNSLAVKNPRLAKEADGWDPKTVSAVNSKKLPWKCSKGHKWEAVVANRAIGGGCPTCSGRKIKVGFNDLVTTHPDIAKEADGWSPKTVTAGSNKKLSWKCSKGHKWEAQVSSRSRGNNCPTCGNAKVLKGFNDLKTTNPKLAKEADGWDPTKYREGSRKKLPWKCSKGHTWEATVSNRSNDKGCPICSGYKLLKGFNDLKTTHPKLAKEADGWDPTTVLAGTSKKLKWKCEYGHQWEAIGHTRVRGNKGKGLGCPICSNQKILVGFNDFESTHPSLAKFADGWDPTMYGSGSRKILQWSCENKHSWKAPIYVRVRNQSCAYCSGDLLWKGFNDLRTTHPEIASEAYEWETDSLMAGSRKKMKWKCQNGHIWASAIYTRTRKRRPSGCPTCSESGFDPNKSAFLYFLAHTSWEMFQIGITNDIDRRLREHKKNSWEILEIRGPMDGHLTKQWEAAILRMLKSKGADLSNAHIAGKFDGYSEAWSKSTFEVKSIKELMKLTEEFEEND